MCKTKKNTCVCVNKEFSCSTPIIKSKNFFVSSAENSLSPDENENSVSAAECADCSQTKASPKTESLFGQVKSLIEFYSEENSVIDAPENDSRFEIALDASNINEHSFILVNEIIEEFTEKRIQDEKNYKDEVREISLAHFVQLRAKDEEIEILRNETDKFSEQFFNTLSEKLELEKKFEEQSKLEESILEENECLKINITKEEWKSKRTIENLLIKNETLIKTHSEMKQKLEDRDQEVEVVRRWRDKEAEMDKSQIENLEAVLEISKVKLLKVNNQIKKVLKDKDNIFIEQNNLDLREDFLEKEKEKFALLQYNFQSSCQNEKNELLKVKTKNEEEKDLLLNKQQLFEAKLQEFENEKNDLLKVKTKNEEEKELLINEQQLFKAKLQEFENYKIEFLKSMVYCGIFIGCGFIMYRNVNN